MPYRIENIGSSFGNREIEALSARLNQNASQGWEFHSVFMVEHRTCLGFSTANTYLAVFRQKQ